MARSFSSLVKRLFSTSERDLAAARQAELRGDLAKAAELFGRAGAKDDAARVMLLRADAEADPRARLPFFVLAASAADSGSPLQKTARARKARTTVDLARGGVLSAAIRADVLAAAKDLEDVGEPADAADAYALAGDRDGQARALTAAGKIDELEALLESDQAAERKSRDRRARAEEIEEAIATGRRRRALELLDDAARADASDRGSRDAAESLRAKALRGSTVGLAIAGKKGHFVLGDAVTVGRTEGQIVVPSHAVSRAHLEIARKGDEIFVRDLGTRNGTTLRGMRIAAEMPVGGGLELALGGEVPIAIRPATDFPGSVEIDVGGQSYVAALGPLRIGAGDWTVALGAGDWVELRFAASPAFLGNVALASPVTLLARDAVKPARDGEVLLEADERVQE